MIMRFAIPAVGTADLASATAELARTARGAVVAWRRALDRARQRAQLAEMPEHLLRDIGLTRAEALREAAKPFWVE